MGKFLYAVYNLGREADFISDVYLLYALFRNNLVIFLETLITIAISTVYHMVASNFVDIPFYRLKDVTKAWDNVQKFNMVIIEDMIVIWSISYVINDYVSFSILLVDCTLIFYRVIKVIKGFENLNRSKLVATFSSILVLCVIATHIVRIVFEYKDLLVIYIIIHMTAMVTVVVNYLKIKDIRRCSSTNYMSIFFYTVSETFHSTNIEERIVKSYISLLVFSIFIYIKYRDQKIFATLKSNFVKTLTHNMALREHQKSMGSRRDSFSIGNIRTDENNNIILPGIPVLPGEGKDGGSEDADEEVGGDAVRRQHTFNLANHKRAQENVQESLKRCGIYF